MEIQRVKFSLLKYLRTRLLKIEDNINSIVASNDIKNRLSAEENAFVARILRLNSNFFEDCLHSRVSESAKEILSEMLETSNSEATFQVYS